MHRPANQAPGHGKTNDPVTAVTCRLGIINANSLLFYILKINLSARLTNAACLHGRRALYKAISGECMNILRDVVQVCTIRQAARMSLDIIFDWNISRFACRACLSPNPSEYNAGADVRSHPWERVPRDFVSFNASSGRGSTDLTASELACRVRRATEISASWPAFIATVSSGAVRIP